MRQELAGDPAGPPPSWAVRLLPPALRNVPVQLPLVPPDAVLRQQQGAAGQLDSRKKEFKTIRVVAQVVEQQTGLRGPWFDSLRLLFSPSF